MIYTFHCKVCHKIQLVNSKDELKALKDKHWYYKNNMKLHVPIKETMHIETRTSRNSGRPYVVLVAD